MTYLLRVDYAYNINAKKVYKLMPMDCYTKKTRLSSDIKRQWVKDLVPKPEQEFEYLEFDIKYFYVHGSKRNAMVLTVIDVKSRWVLDQYIAWSIKGVDVRRLFKKIFSKYDLPTKIYVRSDNGSQFIANEVQKYFAEIKEFTVMQEFIKPASPNQNAAIVLPKKVISQAYYFSDINELKNTMKDSGFFIILKESIQEFTIEAPTNICFKKESTSMSTPF